MDVNTKMAQLSFNCFQNKKMLGLYLSYSLTADIPISVTHSKYFNKALFSTKKGKKVNSNHDHECSIKIMNQTALYQISVKEPDNLTRSYTMIIVTIHTCNYMTSCWLIKIHTEIMIFAMHRIISISYSFLPFIFTNLIIFDKT